MAEFCGRVQICGRVVAEFVAGFVACGRLVARVADDRLTRSATKRIE